MQERFVPCCKIRNLQSDTRKTAAREGTQNVKLGEYSERRGVGQLDDINWVEKVRVNIHKSEGP